MANIFTQAIKNIREFIMAIDRAHFIFNFVESVIFHIFYNLVSKYFIFLFFDWKVITVNIFSRGVPRIEKIRNARIKKMMEIKVTILDDI